MGIGYENKLLEKIPGDLKRFRELTYDCIVVMGKNTFLSLPNKQPLKDRINIVISSTLDTQHENLIICRSLEDFIHYISRFVFVIGGESIYRQLLPYCQEAYVTKINNTYEADRFFPNLDDLSNWELVYKDKEKRYKDFIKDKDFTYSFNKYINKSPLKI